MPSTLLSIADIFRSFTVVSLIDVGITAFLIYKAIGWLRGTQAFQVAKGILMVVTVTLVSSLLGLVTINYAFTNFMTVGLIAVVIIFQPELRRMLDKIGRATFLRVLLRQGGDQELDSLISEIVSAVDEMAAARTGALIIVERDSRIPEIVDTGTRLNARVSRNLLTCVFFPNNSLHDGACIISRDDMIIEAAGCLLPLSQNTSLSRQIGTRHKAAVGVSEICDCVAIVVSEETGTISYAIDGRLSRFADPMTIRTVLNETMTRAERGSSAFALRKKK